MSDKIGKHGDTVEDDIDHSHKSAHESTDFKAANQPADARFGGKTGRYVDVEQNSSFGSKTSFGQAEDQVKHDKRTGVADGLISSDHGGQRNPRREPYEAKSDLTGENVKDVSRAGAIDIQVSKGSKQFGYGNSAGQKANSGDVPIGSDDTNQMSTKEIVGSGSVPTGDESMIGREHHSSNAGAATLNANEKTAGVSGFGNIAGHIESDSDKGRERNGFMDSLSGSKVSAGSEKFDEGSSKTVSGGFGDTRKKLNDEDDDGGIGIGSKDVPAPGIRSENVDGEVKAGNGDDRTGEAEKNEDGDGQSVGITDPKSGFETKSAGVDPESSSMKKIEGIPQADGSKTEEEIHGDGADGEVKADDRDYRADKAARNEDKEGQNVGITDAKSGFETKGSGVDPESSSMTRSEGIPQAHGSKQEEDIEAIKDDAGEAGTVSKSDDSTEAFAGSKRQTQGDDVQTAVQAQTDGDGDGELDTDAAMGQVSAELLVMPLHVLQLNRFKFFLLSFLGGALIRGYLLLTFRPQHFFGRESFAVLVKSILACGAFLQKRASNGAVEEEEAEKEGSSDGGSARLLSGGVQNDALVGAVVASGRR
jgi:hypothetical protein